MDMFSQQHCGCASLSDAGCKNVVVTGPKSACTEFGWRSGAAAAAAEGVEGEGTGRPGDSTARCSAQARQKLSTWSRCNALSKACIYDKVLSAALSAQ
jgi:hypothetical protein